MIRTVQITSATLSGPFGEADLDAEQFGTCAERCVFPPEEWSDTSDIYAVRVPLMAQPEPPATIEAAMRRVVGSAGPRPSWPELPPEAYAKRRS